LHRKNCIKIIQIHQKPPGPRRWPAHLAPFIPIGRLSVSIAGSKSRRLTHFQNPNSFSFLPPPPLSVAQQWRCPWRPATTGKEEGHPPEQGTRRSRSGHPATSSSSLPFSVSHAQSSSSWRPPMAAGGEETAVLPQSFSPTRAFAQG